MSDLGFLSPQAVAALDARIAGEVERQLAEREQARAESPWMTVPEAAEYLRLSPKAIRNRLNWLPHHRLDGRILLRRDELDAAFGAARTYHEDETVNGRATRERPRPGTGGSSSDASAQ